MYAFNECNTDNIQKTKTIKKRNVTNSFVNDMTFFRTSDVRGIELCHRGVQLGPLVQVQLLEEGISRHRVHGRQEQVQGTDIEQL
jgi:hypothetical protein